MTTVAGAPGTLATAIDERELLDDRVRRFVDLVGGTLERVALDRTCELRAGPGRARVVSEQQHVARRGEQVVVPADEELVAPHAMRATVDHDEQRVLLRVIKPRRPHHEAVDAFAATAREPVR